MKTIIWFTGLPKSGKTTIGQLLVDRLRNRGVDSVQLDGNVIRKYINTNLGFSKDDRMVHLKRTFVLAQFITQVNAIPVVTTISPFKYIREEIRNDAENLGISFVLVYVDCPVLVCVRRDKTGIYEKAYSGKIKNFTGVSDPYEKPNQIEYQIKIDSAESSPEQCVDFILQYLENHDHIQKQQPTSLFIGRWQPFHEGHQALIETRLKENKPVTIAMRNTKQDDDNPYSLYDREKMIRKKLEKYGDLVNVITIPDIDEVCIGRKVGYKISRIKLPDEIENISGTKIRNE